VLGAEQLVLMRRRNHLRFFESTFSRSRDPSPAFSPKATASAIACMLNAEQSVDDEAYRGSRSRSAP